MRKVILVFLVLVSLSASVFADGLTVTLQQGDNVNAFYGEDAFKQAYEAATDGAVITLSSGTFNPVDTLAKSVTIVGISAFSSKCAIDHIIIDADNVTIEGVNFGTLTLNGISNCHIKRCYIIALKATDTHTDTHVEQSVVEDDYAVGMGKNYNISNTTLHAFKSLNSPSNGLHVTNCVIWHWYYNNASYYQPYGIYMNNALGIYGPSAYGSTTATVTCSKYSEYYYNLFFKTYACSVNVSFANGCIQQGNEGYPDPNIFTKYFNKNLTYPAGELIINSTGIDGTPKGIYGGSGFEALPSIPRVTSKTIDSYTDTQGKINVKISATIGSN